MDTTAGTGGAGPRLLLVDDDPAVAAVAAACLRARGFVVTVHTDGTSALEALRRCPAAFDVLLTDQEMPGMTGVELVRAVGAVRLDLPVFVYTGDSDRLTPDAVRALGIRAVVQKPVVYSPLAQAMRAAAGWPAAAER